MNNTLSHPSALDTQVDGNHYKDMAIQPVVFCHANKIPPIESSIIRYACRHKKKNGAVDVMKIIHYAKILLELDYNLSPDEIAQL